MRVPLQAILTAAILAAVAAGEFQITLPKSWTVSARERGFTASGPHGAVLTVTTYRIKGGTKDSEGQRAAANVRAAAFESVAQLVKKGSLVEQMAAKEKRLRSATLTEALYTSADARRYLAMYVLTGTTSVAVASVEGDAIEVRQILDIRNALVAAGGGAL